MFRGRKTSFKKFSSPVPPSFKNFYTGIGHKTGKNAPPDTPSLPAAPIAPPKPPPAASSLPPAPPSLPKPRWAPCSPPLTSAAQAYYAGAPGALAPGEIKYKVSPFPGGEGGRGDGGRKVNKRQGRQAAKKASPPLDSLFPALNQRRAGLLRRGAGGVSPADISVLLLYLGLR